MHARVVLIEHCHVVLADERVSTELKKQIVQARTAKKLTQAQLGQVRNAAHGQQLRWQGIRVEKGDIQQHLHHGLELQDVTMQQQHPGSAACMLQVQGMAQLHMQ
jgi:hypothetical protein